MFLAKVCMVALFSAFWVSRSWGEPALWRDVENNKQFSEAELIQLNSAEIVTMNPHNSRFREYQKVYINSLRAMKKVSQSLPINFYRFFVDRVDSTVYAGNSCREVDGRNGKILVDSPILSFQAGVVILYDGWFRIARENPFKGAAFLIHEARHRDVGHSLCRNNRSFIAYNTVNCDAEYSGGWRNGGAYAYGIAFLNYALSKTRNSSMKLSIMKSINFQSIYLENLNSTNGDINLWINEARSNLISSGHSANIVWGNKSTCSLY